MGTHERDENGESQSRFRKKIMEKKGLECMRETFAVSR